VGLLSVFFSALAVTLSGFAAGLPLWSIKASNNLAGTPSATFTAGVWGYCTEISFSNQGHQSLALSVETSGQCNLFYSGNKNVRVDLSNNNNTIVSPKPGACTTFAEDNGAEKRLFATVDGMISLKVFDDFLDKTCGSQGKLTISFAMLSPIFGVLGAILLFVGVCCAKNRSCIVAFAAFMSGLAAIFSIIAFVTWNQQRPYGANFNLGASYYMSVGGTVFYLTSCFFVMVHMQQGRKDNVKVGRKDDKTSVALQSILDKKKMKFSTSRPPALSV
jgi:hypothetical protein